MSISENQENTVDDSLTSTLFPLISPHNNNWNLSVQTFLRRVFANQHNHKLLVTSNGTLRFCRIIFTLCFSWSNKRMFFSYVNVVKSSCTKCETAHNFGKTPSVAYRYGLIDSILPSPRACTGIILLKYLLAFCDGLSRWVDEFPLQFTYTYRYVQPDTFLYFPIYVCSCICAQNRVWILLQIGRAILLILDAWCPSDNRSMK